MADFNLVAVWCEWGIGQEGRVFKNVYVAERWLKNNLVLKELAKEEGSTMDEYYQELIDNGLIGIEDLELIE